MEYFIKTHTRYNTHTHKKMGIFCQHNYDKYQQRYYYEFTKYFKEKQKPLPVIHIKHYDHA